MNDNANALIQTIRDLNAIRQLKRLRQISPAIEEYVEQKQSEAIERIERPLRLVTNDVSQATGD